MKGGERKDRSTTGKFHVLKPEEIFRARNGTLCHKGWALLKKESMKYKLWLTQVFIINELLLFSSKNAHENVLQGKFLIGPFNITLYPYTTVICAQLGSCTSFSSSSLLPPSCIFSQKHLTSHLCNMAYRSWCSVCNKAKKSVLSRKMQLSSIFCFCLLLMTVFLLPLPPAMQVMQSVP